MTKPFEDYSLAEAVEDWWDTNIEKIKQKLGQERFVNELDAAVRGRSEYLQTAVSKALLTKKYKWEDTEITRSDNQDEIEETLANLASQDKDWRDERWDSFEESHNGDSVSISKLEQRIARLEKLARYCYMHESADSDSNLEYISDDIERGLRIELGVNSWNISAKPVYNKRYNDNYVEVTIEGNGYDVPSECIGIFKVYRRGFGYRITVDDNKNRHIGSLDSLDEVVSMISDIMTVKGEDFYE